MKLELDIETAEDVFLEDLKILSPKENLLMLLIGYNAVRVFKKNAINETAYYEVIKRELSQHYETLLQKAAIEKDAQRAVYDDLVREERARKGGEAAFFEKQYNRALETIDTLKNDLAAARGELANAENNAKLEREKEGFEVRLKIAREKNEKLEQMIEQFQAATAAAKGNVGRGQQGENFFYDLVVETFGEYEGFQITNTAKTGHAGDFHIQFKDFSILADSKNFIDTSGVSSTDRNKLKFDMKQNQHIKIAWLVSMDKPIRRFSKYPFMIELHDGVCYCYINSLKTCENPGKLLEMAWYSCQFVHDTILTREDDTHTIEKYKKYALRVHEIATKLKKMSKERYAMLKQLTENFDNTEKEIMEILNCEVMNIRVSHANMVRQWWDENYFACGGAAPKLKSGQLWKKCHEKYPEINEDMFKQILREILPAADIEIPKSKTAQYTISGWSARA